MRSPARPLLCGLLLASLLAAAGSALAGPGDPVLRQPVQERIQTGAAAYHHGVGEDPYARGAIELPDDATHVHFSLRWTAETGPKPLTFRACDGWCANDSDGDGIREDEASAVLARTHGASPITMRVPVPSSGNLTWDAYLENGTAVDVRIHGWANVFDASPSHISHGWTAPAATFVTRAPAPPGSFPGALVDHAGAVAGGLVALLAAWAALRRWTPSVLAALYSRIDGDELLDHAKRRTIYELVHERPGIHFEAIADELGIGHGALDHHLRRLTAEGLIEELRANRYRLYFLPGHLTRAERLALAHAKSKGARALLETLAEARRAQLTDLARAADLATSTASYHVDRLVEHALVDAERTGRERRMRITRLGERVLELL